MIRPPQLVPRGATQASYERLADAFGGVLFETDEAVGQELSRLEGQLQQQVLNLLAGKLPLSSLPILPTTSNALLARVNSADVVVEQLQTYINEDPSIAIDVMKLANNTYRRKAPKPFINIHEAVLSLELNELKSMLLTVLMQPTIQIKPIYFKLFGRQLWEHARDCAQACAQLSAEHHVDYFDAHLMGLVHDVGKIVMFKLLCGAFRSTGSAVSPGADVLGNLLKEYANKLSQLVLRNWSFPQVYLDALKDQERSGDPKHMSPLGRTLYFGNLLAEAHLILQRHRFPRESMEKVLEQFGLSLALVYAVFPSAPRPQLR